VGIRDALMAAFILCSVPFCFLRPLYGLALWTIIAFVNPQSYLYGNIDMRWAQMVIVPTIAGTLVFRRGSWGGLRLLQPVLIIVLGVWFSITTLASINNPVFAHHAQDTWQRWSTVSKILGVTLLTIPILDTFERLRTFALILASCFGLFVLKSLPFVVLTGGSQRLYGPPDSMIADNNDFGLALNMTLPLYFFLGQTETRPWLKRTLMLLAVATVPVILFTYSRGALVGLLMTGAVMFVYVPMRQRLLLTPLLLLTTFLGLLFAPDEWRDRMKSIGEYSEDRSAQSRLNAWRYAASLAADYPITGGGFATFTRELFQRYSPPGAREVFTAHSVYFQLLAEHGYTGLFVYLMLLFSSYLAAAKLVKQARRIGDPIVMRYANMFRFSLIAFATSGAFLSRAYFDYFFCIVACIVVLKILARQHWSMADQYDEDEENSDAEIEPGVYAASRTALQFRGMLLPQEVRPCV
jgi:putative inorganic carbon (hco3(-)) transporter